jgi:thioredoxin reductase (NADPH)
MLHPTFREATIRLVGDRWSPRVHELKRFLGRSGVPFLWFDIELENDPEVRRLAALAGVESEFPLVILPDGSLLADPDVESLADRLGLPTVPASSLYDLVVVGGGPAGLAAAIHAGSEGLHTLVIDGDVPGGQVTYSAAVENYPGFPGALDGSDLARRMVEQAERFGVEVIITRRATSLAIDGLERRVTLDDGSAPAARTILISIGVSFRWLESPGCAALVGAGIYYGAATVEASACAGQEVYILGGGNSAGQAALLLARFARRVHILTNKDSLNESMSRYLIDRIERTPNINVHPHSTVVDAGGGEHLEWLLVRDTASGETTRLPATALFVFIGAVPRSDWLAGLVDRDDEGFLLTGFDYLAGGGPGGWPLRRRPYPLETRIPGVFAAGDARRGSVKRLAAAVGDGVAAIDFVHRYLDEAFGERPPRAEVAQVRGSAAPVAMR